MEEGKLKDQTSIDVLKILGDYRELKDKLGCDPMKVLKALTEGCWTMTRYKQVKHVLPCEIRLGVRYGGSAKCVEEFMCLGIETVDDKHYDIKTEEYGKTWASTKEELL